MYIFRAFAYFLPANQEIWYLPLDFRRKFISILKKALDGSPEYQVLYGERESHFAKPFTFAVKFDQIVSTSRNGESFFTLKGGATLIISSPLRWIVSSFCRGLNSFLATKIDVGFSSESEDMVSSLVLASVQASAYTVFDDAQSDTVTALVKTVSPVVVREGESFLGNPWLDSQRSSDIVNTVDKKRWLKLIHKGLENLAQGFEELADRIKSTKDNLRSADNVEELSTLKLPLDEINRLDVKGVKTKELLIHHYDAVIPSVVGSLVLSGPKKIVHICLAAGLGDKRSQGFGMITLK